MTIVDDTAREIRQKHLSNIERILEQAVADTGKDAKDCRLESVTQAAGETVYYVDGSPVLTDHGLVNDGVSMKFKVTAHKRQA